MAQSGITNGGYPTGKNPRPASITTILDDNSQSQVTMQYDNSAVPVAAGAPQNFTGSGSVTDKIETDIGATAPGPVLRETVATYTSLGNHILGLPNDIKIKDGAGKAFSQRTLQRMVDSALRIVDVVASGYYQRIRALSRQAVGKVGQNSQQSHAGHVTARFLAVAHLPVHQTGEQEDRQRQ